MSVRSAVPGIIPRRVIHVTAALAAIALMGLTAAMADAAVINDPPPAGRSLVAFPARDFVSGDGYLDDHAYRVEVEHPASLGGGIIVSQRRLSPTGGVLEVNHPGGGCWAGSTPDIRPGDIVRVIDEDTGEVDQTTVANVTAKRPVQTGPGSVEIHGTAMTADGAPMPLDALERHRGPVGGHRGPVDLDGAGPGLDRTLRRHVGDRRLVDLAGVLVDDADDVPRPDVRRRACQM